MRNKTITKQVPVINYEKWYNKLPLDKQLYIANMVKKKIDKIHADTTEILDSCFIGAMIEELEMDLDKCIEVAKKANINMHETFKKLESEGSGYYVRVNDSKVRETIIESAKERLIKSPKKSTIDISRELQESYDLPLKDLHILVAESRKELKENGKEKFLNDIGVEMQEILNKEVAADGESKTVIKQVAEDAKAKSTMEFKENGKVISTVERKPTLKIKSMIIEGQYETYEKGSEGVKTKNIIVKDTKDLADYKESVNKEYIRRKQELLDKLEGIKTEIEQLEDKANNNFGIIDEIEQIFNM